MSNIGASRRQGSAGEPRSAPDDNARAGRAEPENGTIDSAIALLTRLLRDATGCTDAAVFELRRTEAQAAKSSVDELVSAVLADGRCLTGLPDGFSLGRRQGRHMMGIRLSDKGVGLAAGYVLYDTEPAARDLAAIGAFCALGSRFLAGARKDRARRHSENHTQAFQSRMGDALGLGADAYWEADASSIVRRIVQLESAFDPGYLAKLEGKNLRTLSSREDLLGGGEFRNIKVTLDAPGLPTQTMELSGRALPDATWQGIARLVRGRRDAPASIQQARSLVDMVQTSRQHENVAHRETELILDGLRILTSGRSDPEILRSLLDLLAPAIEFQDAVVLKREWSGSIAPRVGTLQSLLEAEWQGAAASLFASDDVAAILKIPGDLSIPGATDRDDYVSGSALAIKLRGGSKATVLLCLHRSADAFGARHQGLGARLSLVASQAFMNEDERQKVVDASKLATIGELAAGIVHEIRQPLTVMTLAVNNLIDVMQSGRELDTAKLLAKLERLKVQTERVGKIIATMRVLARHSDGVLEPFGVAANVREASGLIQHKLTADAVELEIRIDEALQAHGNALEFGQVILNLLSNGHDAIMSKGSAAKPCDTAARRLSVSAEGVDAQWVEIVVRDTGCGFPQTEAERAFEPFFTTKEPGKGTGLGLALCRRIVENMRGTISLGNWAGGAEIRLRLKRS